MDYKGKNNRQEQIGQHRCPVLWWCSEWPHPKPSATCRVAVPVLLLFGLCPFWLSGLCMEMGHKYPKTTSFTGCLALVIGPHVGKKGKKKTWTFFHSLEWDLSQNVALKDHSVHWFSNRAQQIPSEVIQGKENKEGGFSRLSFRLLHSLHQPKQLILAS